jgi:hypothetical protein
LTTKSFLQKSPLSIEIDFIDQMNNAIDGVDWETETTSLSTVEKQMKEIQNVEEEVRKFK